MNILRFMKIYAVALMLFGMVLIIVNSVCAEENKIGIYFNDGSTKSKVYDRFKYLLCEELSKSNIFTIKQNEKVSQCWTLTFLTAPLFVENPGLGTWLSYTLCVVDKKSELFVYTGIFGIVVKNEKEQAQSFITVLNNMIPLMQTVIDKNNELFYAFQLEVKKEFDKLKEKNKELLNKCIILKNKSWWEKLKESIGLTEEKEDVGENSFGKIKSNSADISPSNSIIFRVGYF